MADNTTLPGTGEVIRDKDRTGVKTQISGLDLNPAGAETLMAGTMPVEGVEANDAPSTSKPVGLGVLASAATPTAVSADGDRVAVRGTTTGAVYVVVTNLGGTGVAALATAADDMTPGSGSVVLGQLMLFDGTNWDRARGDITGGIWAQGGVAHDSADTGNPNKTGGKAANAVPTAVAAADRVNAWYDLNGRFVTTQNCDTATPSNVGASLTSVTVLAANTGRKGAMIVNDGYSDMYLKYGSGASATSFSAKLTPGASHPVQFGYTGILTALWTVVSGSARVTELT